MRRQALSRARIDSSPGKGGLLRTIEGRGVIAAGDDASPLEGNNRQMRPSRRTVPPLTDAEVLMGATA
jgi:hypothetical protein